MKEPFKIEPNAILDDDILCRGALNIPSEVMSEARTTGALRCVRLGEKYYYLGHWITGWLERIAVAGGDSGRGK